jgi:beta-fructofuranosidase
MNYHPKNMYHWDFWMIERESRLHSFHLFRLRPGAVIDPVKLEWLGHAVSDDLINWHEEPMVIPPGPPGSLDDMKHYTGDVVEKDGLYYLFYTGRSSREEGRVQRTMLATSPDLYEWTKYENNPVMEADPRWYTAKRVAERGYGIGWRDPKVVLDENTGWYYAFLAADLPNSDWGERGCVARARSRDLLHWEIMPPAFTPGKYATIEVPDVFLLDGRWYMTILTGIWYGNPRGTFTDPNVNMGTIYAVSDRLDGEFHELDDSVLLGTKWWESVCCRTVEFQGKRYLFYFQCEREGDNDCGEQSFLGGTLTTPKELRTTPEGYLRAVYSPLIEKKVTETLFRGMPGSLRKDSIHQVNGNWQIDGKGATGVCHTGWSSVITEESAGPFIMTGKVKMRQGRAAGLVFHAPDIDMTVVANAYYGKRRIPFYAVLLDYERQMIFFTKLWEFDTLQARSVKLEYGKPYGIRIVAKGKFYEVYLDDVLMFNFVRYALPEGHFGLMVENGEAEFSDLLALGLDVT